MILKTQTYNHKTGLIKDDEIKLLGEDRPIVNYELYENGFSHKDYVFEEVLVDFKCDWSRIIENHLDILHILSLIHI